jgi:cation:H+ antiporter
VALAGAPKSGRDEVILAAVQIVGGLIVLLVGGHLLVQGAVVMAMLARLSTAVVALTVVAMGTSLPEMAVSLDAAARQSTDIAYGNVIGSCLFNLGAILGVAAVLAPIPVQRQTIRFEYPVMFLSALLTVILAWDGRVSRFDGIALVIVLVVFMSSMVVLAKRGVPLSEVQALDQDVRRTAHIKAGTRRAWSKSTVLVLGGIVALVIGADLAVSGSVTIARTLGIEERVIGLTIIAMGTSLPELATSVVATARGENEIALGNVVGSNIFNVLAILGITATIFPVPVHDRAIALDNWAMLAFSVVLFPMMLRGRRISGTNAVLLLVGFVTFMGYVLAFEL